MAGPNPGAAATPCKMTKTDDDIEVNAGDLPVPVTIASDPASCNFTIAQVVVFDANGTQVDNQAHINATSAKIPPTKNTLPAGPYDVFINVSPASGAPPGDPFNGGRARITENCTGKTLLFLANANFPTPQFTLVVK